MNVSQPSKQTAELFLNQKKAFKQFLISKGLRITKERFIILEASFNHSEHFTAEELLTASKLLDQSASRATIYRTLPLLIESGLVREVDVGRDYKYYMAEKETKTFQTQVICTDCDKIFEVDAPFMEWYGKTVSEKLGMAPLSQRLQINSACLKKGNNTTCQRSNIEHHHA